MIADHEQERWCVYVCVCVSWGRLEEEVRNEEGVVFGDVNHPGGLGRGRNFP